MPKGKKSSLEEKLNKGTVNTTREKAAAANIQNANQDVADYLTKTTEMLNRLWEKLNDVSVQGNIGELEKYSRLFLMYQKHYYAHLQYLPKDIKNGDVISELISKKEL